MPSSKSKSPKRQAQRQAQAKEDKSLLVTLENPPLTNAFGEPFSLANYRFDQELVLAVRDQLGDDPDPNTKSVHLDDLDEDIDLEDDPRLKRSVHADMNYAIEFFLRSRDPQGQSYLVKGQGDSDHIADLGEALQAARDNGVVTMPKGDYRWLVQKAKELGHKVYPFDSTMFIRHLEQAEKQASEDSVEPTKE